MQIQDQRFNLADQIAELAAIDSTLLKTMAGEALHLDCPWTCEYAEYQNGGWKTLSLYNASKLSTDTVIEDGLGQETELLRQMPTTQNFLKKLKLPIMFARLAKLEPRAFLWEHRDYTELDARKRIRLHLPLVTNSNSLMVIEGYAVHMHAGNLWMLDPTERHGACNLGLDPRIHLIIDVYVNEDVQSLLDTRKLQETSVRSLPSPNTNQIQTIIQSACGLAKLGYRSSAEAILLKCFHRFQLEEGAGYDFVAEMYAALNDNISYRNWTEKKHFYLNGGQRGTTFVRNSTSAKQA